MFDVYSSNQTNYSIPDQRRLHFAVLQSFCASSPNELSLSKHDIVSVIENSPSGWSWVNEPNVGAGWFPTNYLEPLVFPKKKDTTPERHVTDLPSSPDKHYLDVIGEESQYVYASHEEIQKVKKEGRYQEYEAKAYRASYSYTGSNADELTFKENETILVLQETETGWWRGSTYLGEGWFPGTFVEDPVRCQDTATATPHLQAADSYEEHQHDYPIAPQCNEPSQAVSPYQVTKLAPQSQPVKANDRDAVHQVPHGISQEAVKRHKKSRDKTARLKPSRPAPPPPATPRPTALQEASPPAETAEALPLLPSPPSRGALPGDTPSCAFPLNPPSRTAPTEPTSEAPTSKQENENSEQAGNVEGVVIVRPREQSEANLSTLIRVTKRRSVINPNPVERPPNRPVPIPPPRKARPKATENHPRSRPIKMPRNKKFDNINNNIPQVVPERPPPSIPAGKLALKRLSASELTTGSKSSSIEQKLNQEYVPRQQSDSDNEQKLDEDKAFVHGSINQNEVDDVSQVNGGVDIDNKIEFDASGKNGHRNKEANTNATYKENDEEKAATNLHPKPKQRNPKPSKGQEDEVIENKKDQDINSGKVSPKPKPRKRSGEEGKNKGNNVSMPQQPVRSQSLPDEPEPSEEKPRPMIMPRSKSLADIFSSKRRKDNGDNSEEKATSQPQPRPRGHSSSEATSLSHQGNRDNISESHGQRNYQHDINQNMAEESIKPFCPPSRGPPKPKPKARTKH